MLLDDGLRDGLTSRVARDDLEDSEVEPGFSCRKVKHRWFDART